MIREMFEELPVISSLMALFLITLAFIFRDGLLLKPESYSGTIIDKHYSSETHRKGSGVVITNSGNAHVVTTEKEPEKFILIIKSENGEVVTAKCKPELYYEKEIGQPIKFEIYKGRFSGKYWDVRAVR